MVRVLRLGRLLFAVERFRMFGSISLEIIPAATSVFMVLLFISYFFGSLGMLLFGGDITRDPNNPKAALLLEAEDFVGKWFLENRFHSTPSHSPTLLSRQRVLRQQLQRYAFVDASVVQLARREQLASAN